MYSEETYINIPHNRVGAVIGKEGKDKKDLEELSRTKIDIDSQTGEVTLIKDKADAFTFYRMGDVIKAIGRGFSPKHAKLLLEEQYLLEIIELRDFGLEDKSAETKRARVIGTKGTVRKYLETSLDCHIAIQGKTICIIGPTPEVNYARDAIETILSGGNIPAMKKQIEKKIIKRRQTTSVEEW